MDQRHFLLIAKALADPTRHRILRAITRGGETCCADLHRGAGVAKATLSHHLRVLSDAELIRVERDGPFHYITLNRRTLRAFAGAASDPAALADTDVPKARRRPRGPTTRRTARADRR